MPLSDHEKRLLAQMEEALASDDPRLVDVLSSGKVGRPRLGLAILSMLAGVAILFAGLLTKTTIVGVLGFVIGLVGLLLLLNSISIKAPGRPVGFKARMEERWDRRNQ